MRGEASRIADRVSRDSLAPKLRGSGEDAWRIGNELFTITSVLDHNIQLERALHRYSFPLIFTGNRFEFSAFYLMFNIVKMRCY